MLCPPPVPFKHTADFQFVEAEVQQTLDIKGKDLIFDAFQLYYNGDLNTKLGNKKA